MSNNYQHIKSSFADTARKLAPRKTLLQRLSSPVVSALLTPFLAYSLAYGGNTDTKSIKPYSTKTPAVSYSHDELVLGDEVFLRKDLEKDEQVKLGDKIIDRKAIIGGKFINKSDLIERIEGKRVTTCPAEGAGYWVLVALEQGNDNKLNIEDDQEVEPIRVNIGKERDLSDDKSTGTTSQYAQKRKSQTTPKDHHGIDISGSKCIVLKTGKGFENSLSDDLANSLSRQQYLFAITKGEYGIKFVTTRNHKDKTEQDSLQASSYALFEVEIEKYALKDDDRSTNFIEEPAEAGETDQVIKAQSRKALRGLFHNFKRARKPSDVPIPPEVREEEMSAQPSPQPPQPIVQPSPKKEEAK